MVQVLTRIIAGSGPITSVQFVTELMAVYGSNPDLNELRVSNTTHTTGFLLIAPWATWLNTTIRTLYRNSAIPPVSGNGTGFLELPAGNFISRVGIRLDPANPLIWFSNFATNTYRYAAVANAGGVPGNVVVRVNAGTAEIEIAPSTVDANLNQYRFWGVTTNGREIYIEGLMPSYLETETILFDQRSRYTALALANTSGAPAPTSGLLTPVDSTLTRFNVVAYPPGTVPPLTTTSLTFDLSAGTNGRPESAPTVDNTSFPAGLNDGAPNKYFSPGNPVLLSQFANAGFIKLRATISQHSPGFASARVASRDTRVEYGKTLIQYWSKLQQRWLIVYNDIQQPIAPVENYWTNNAGPAAYADAFALPNGNISVRSGTNARALAGALRNDNSSFLVQTEGPLIPLNWSDAECVLMTTPMRAVGPGSESAFKYIGRTACKIHGGNFAQIDNDGIGDENVARYKPIDGTWQQYAYGMGPVLARIATNPPFGTVASPLPVSVSAGSSLAQLRTNLIAAVAANPTGNLNLLVTPANATITDPGSITLADTDGFTAARAIAIDFNGLTLTGGEVAIDAPSLRVPIFVEPIPAKAAAAPPLGTNYKISIRDTRWQTAPAGEKSLLGASATTLYCTIRFAWFELRTTLTNPVRAGGVTTWDMNTEASNDLRTIWPFVNNQEITFEGGTAYDSFALKPLYAEPGANDLAAIVLRGTKTTPVSLTMFNLTIRDRALQDKAYFLDQQNDALLQNSVSLPTRWLPCKGLRLLEANNVRIANCNFYNIDGQALTTNAWTRNVRIDRNVFHKIGGQAISKGIEYLTLGDPLGVIVNTDYGFGITIEKNAFYLIGVNQFTGAAIYVGSGMLDSFIRQNIIEEVAYSAIAVGYPRGFRNTRRAGVLQFDQNQWKNLDIDGNLIQKVMTASVDGGAIYTKGSMLQGKIRNNHLRLVGPTSLNNTAFPPNNFYGTQVGVGASAVNYPAPVAHLYHDNGAFGWVASNNVYGDQKYTPYQPKLFLQSSNAVLTGNSQAAPEQYIAANPGATIAEYNVEAGADQTMTSGEVAGPSIWGPVNAVPVAVPLVNGLVDRRVWFNSYNVAP
jgi:hypothetical protein